MCAKVRLIVEMAKKNAEKVVQVVAKLLFYIGWLGVELV